MRTTLSERVGKHFHALNLQSCRFRTLSVQHWYPLKDDGISAPVHKLNEKAKFNGRFNLCKPVDE